MSSPVLLSDDFYGHRIVLGKLNGDDSSSTVVSEEDEETVFFGDNSPEDVAEEETKHLCFYFVKQIAYDDPEIKAKIDEANKEIYQCNIDRIRITKLLNSKRSEKLSLDASMENLISSLDGYKSMTMAINEVKKDEEVVTGEIYSLNEKLSELKVEIDLLNAQLVFALDLRDKAFERIQMLRLQRDKGNAAFFQNLVVKRKAIRLAASGNVKDLEEFSYSEVEKFMSRWNNDKAFRDDYKKRVLPSFDDRKLRCDGRIRELEEDYKSFSSEEESEDATDFYIPVYEKLGKEEEGIDEETLKERKREEQLEKARLAMERKRKLHEKAAAKAAIRVKKDADKKLKELEKRAKKKNKAAAFSSSSSDGDKTTKTVTDASKPEKEKLLSERSVFIHQSNFRYKHHGKGNEAVLKAIMKRKKTYRLWVWAVSLAALAFPLALLVYFFYI